MRARAFWITGAVALGAMASAAVAAAAGPQPLQVQSSSLVQQGQQLTWKLQLTAPFSPAALGRAGRSLCLLLERPGNGSVTGQLCVVGPRPGGHSARIVYQKVGRSGPGKPMAVNASISRAGARTLSATFKPTSFGMAYQPIRWQVINTLRPPACTPPKPNRAGCLTLFPAKPALARLHRPRLVGCVPSGSPFVSNGSRNRRVVALTFDDGPWYDTTQFLDVLEHYHVVATFFEIGEQISTYGQGGAVERRMLADGDMLGDHTWSHPNVSGAGSFAAGQISSTAAAIRQATGGFMPCLFRAPYGATSPALIAEASSMGFATIQWDVDPTDWARPGTGAIYSRVVGGVRPGSIVLQHDGGGNRSQTLAALPQEIQTLRSRGYRFVTVTQLLGQRLIYR
ncbi:MAG TPA: polysaccharide deacetylase family protein [Solirubrobacteraceae bacterium]